MKKVLLVATVQSHICQFHLPLIKMLKENGYEVHIAARDNLAEKNGLKLENVDKVYDVKFSRSPFSKNNITAYRQLKKITMENKYDIIHCNTPMGGAITRIIGKKLRKQGTKIIYTAHGFHFYKGGPVLSWIIYYPIEKWLSRYTDVLITINTEDYELAKKRFRAKETKLVNGVGINEDKFKNAILNEEEKKELKNKMQIKKNDFVFMSIGELNKNKNQIMQIEAIKEICKENKNVKLFMAGNGPLKDFYEEKIKEYGLSNNVFLLGYRKDIPQLLQIVDCLISTSIREGLPINILEALYFQVPVVASSNRGHKEIVINNINGFLLNNNTVKELEKGIMKIYNKENFNKEKVKDSAKKFSTKNVLFLMEKIYNNLD